MKEVHFSCWMKDFGEMESSIMDGTKMLDIPINRLVLLGSHDSGTYQHVGGKSLAENSPEGLKKAFKIQDLAVLAFSPSFIVKEITLYNVVKFAKCQTHSILTQLQRGVRYLDIRVGMFKGKPFLCHSIYCVSLEEIFIQIRDFVEENDREMVIIDVQHAFSLDVLPPLFLECYQKYLQEYTYIIPERKSRNSESISIPTLRDCWKEGKKIIMIIQSKLHSRIKSATKLGLNTRNSWIRSYWPQSATIKKTIRLIEQEIDDHFETTVLKHQQFHVSQCVVTPDFFDCLKYYSMLSLGRRCTNRVSEVLNNEWKDKEIGIIMVDHCCVNEDLIKKLILRNVKIKERKQDLSDQSSQEEEEEESEGESQSDDDDDDDCS